MNAPKGLETEERILRTLDRQLLKIADKLDDSFDPDDDDAVKMLKLYRSMMTTRRMWAKEYNLVQVPEPIEAEPATVIADEPGNGSGNGQPREKIANFLNHETPKPSPNRKKKVSRRKRRALRR